MPAASASPRNGRRLLHRQLEMSQSYEMPPEAGAHSHGNRALLSGDPWDGNEDLAYEGLLEWFADGRRRDPPPRPQQESNSDEHPSTRWQGVLASYFNAPNPRNAVGEARQRLCEEIDSLLNRTDQMLQRSPMSPRHRQQSRPSQSVSGVTSHSLPAEESLRQPGDPVQAVPSSPRDQNTEQQVVRQAPESFQHSVAGQRGRQQSLAGSPGPLRTPPRASSCLRGMPGPRRSSAPLRGPRALSLSSVSTRSSLPSRARSSSSEVRAGRNVASSSTSPSAEQTYIRSPRAERPGVNMSPEEWQAYHLACANGMVGCAQVIAERGGSGAASASLNQSVQLCDDLVSKVNEALLKLSRSSYAAESPRG